MALLGPNGAGKTTLLKILADLMLPDGGSVSLLGTDKYDHHEVAYLPDDLGFWPHLTGADNLLTFAQVSGLRPTASTVRNLLDRVGLMQVAHNRCGGYSLGERRRLGLALILLRRPRVVLLDEPLTGLDPDGTKLFRSVIREFVNNGASILISSHDLSEMEKLAEAVAFIRHGSVLHVGPMNELLHQTGRWRLRVDHPEVMLEALKGIDLIIEARVMDDHCLLVGARSDPSDAIMKAVGDHRLALKEWTFVPDSLEEIWSSFAGSSSHEGGSY